MNTQIHSTTNDSPYHLVFAQRPRSNWSLLLELESMGIIDEEDIPDNVNIEGEDGNHDGDEDDDENGDGDEDDNSDNNDGDGCENYENELENIVGNVSVMAHSGIMAKTMSIYH